MKAILRNIWGILGVTVAVPTSYLFYAVIWYMYQDTLTPYHSGEEGIFLARCMCGLLALGVTVVDGLYLREFIEEWKKDE